MSFREQVLAEHVGAAFFVCLGLFAVWLVGAGLWHIFVTAPRHRKRMATGYLMLYKMRNGIYDLPTHPRRTAEQVARDDALLLRSTL